MKLTPKHDPNEGHFHDRMGGPQNLLEVRVHGIN